MTMFNFALRACAIGIASIPALGLSMPVAIADGAQTPGATEPTDAASRGVSPYVPPADVYVPDSSKELPGDAGKRAHTNILIRNPSGIPPKGISDLSQPAPVPSPFSNHTPEEPPEK